MANFSPICSWTLRFEDSRLEGKVEDLGDGEGLTRFGLTQKSDGMLPYYFQAPVDVALTMAQAKYQRSYWLPIQGNNINDDKLAAAIYDFCVNSGQPRAIKILQGLLNAGVDGDVGNETLTAINSADPVALAAQLRTARAAWDTEVAKNNPNDAKFLPDWLRRAAAIFPDGNGLF